MSETGGLAGFAPRIIAWQALYGRHNLPWHTSDAYAVWLSEIMLQQTQVATVIPYYQRFMAAFPTVADLAAAPLDAVLAQWSGLGYYSRARNLHAAACRVVAQFSGEFPRDPVLLQTLPGVGRSTAAAIAVFSAGARAAILDGNVKRVLCRWAGVQGYPGDTAIQQQLWALAETVLPAAVPAAANMRAYTQGQMDLGATVCTRSKPRCSICPLQADCVANRHGLTDTLPSPKPRKPLPRRAVTLLLLMHEGRLLLQKRPAPGIWGGLWSLPEAPSPSHPASIQATIAHLGFQGDYHTSLPEIAHTFTHFHLQISAEVWWVIPAGGEAAADEDYAWFRPEEALQAGIPAPVRKILNGWLTG